MSFHYWRNRGQPEKRDFVSLANGYHGETLGALSVTDVPLFRDTYAPLLRQTAQVPTPGRAARANRARPRATYAAALRAGARGAPRRAPRDAPPR